MLSHLCVIVETTSGLSGAEIPETQGLVPGTGEGIVAIAGEDNVRDEMRVSVEPLVGDSVAELVLCEFPHDQGLVWNLKQHTLRRVLVTWVMFNLHRKHQSHIRITAHGYHVVIVLFYIMSWRKNVKIGNGIDQNRQGIHRKTIQVKYIQGWIGFGDGRNVWRRSNGAWKLPLEADKIMLGYFGLVAIWVTQPLCPKRVPRCCRVSDISYFVGCDRRRPYAPKARMERTWHGTVLPVSYICSKQSRSGAILYSTFCNIENQIWIFCEKFIDIFFNFKIWN